MNSVRIPNLLTSSCYSINRRCYKTQLQDLLFYVRDQAETTMTPEKCKATFTPDNCGRSRAAVDITFAYHVEEVHVRGVQYIYAAVGIRPDCLGD